MLLFATQLILENADKAVYNERERKIEATGSVKVKYGKLSLKANRLVYYIDQDKIEASGHVEIKEGNKLFWADRIEYYPSKEEGTFWRVRTEYSGIYFYGAKIKRKKDVLKFYNAYFTTCNAAAPHYYLAARFIKLDKDWIEARWIYFVVGHIPVFPPLLPWPYLKRNLKAREALKVRTGRSQYLGGYSAIAYRTPRGFSAELLLSSERGFAPAVEWGGTLFKKLKVGVRTGGIWEGLIWGKSGLTGRPIRGHLSLTGSYRITRHFRIFGESTLISDPQYLIHYSPQAFGLYPRSSIGLSYSRRGFVLGIATRLIYSWENEKAVVNYSEIPTVDLAYSKGSFSIRGYIKRITNKKAIVYEQLSSISYYKIGNNLKIKRQLKYGLFSAIGNLSLNEEHYYFTELKRHFDNPWIEASGKITLGNRAFSAETGLSSRYYIFPKVELPISTISNYHSLKANGILKMNLGIFKSSLSTSVDLLQPKYPWQKFSPLSFYTSINPKHFKLSLNIGYDFYWGEICRISLNTGISTKFLRVDLNYYQNSNYVYFPTPPRRGETSRVIMLSLDTGNIFLLGGNISFYLNARYSLNDKKFVQLQTGFIRDLHCWEGGIGYDHFTGRLSIFLTLKGFPYIKVYREFLMEGP